MEFDITYGRINSVKSEYWKLIVEKNAMKHVLENHWPNASKFWKTKFKNEGEIWELLWSNPHLEQIWTTLEFRWGDLSWKNNITARKIWRGKFELITLFNKN